MVVSALFLLSSLGLAVLAQAQDCSKPVLEHPLTLSDEDIVKVTFPDGSTVRLKCVVGHLPAAGGSRTITCTAGSWSSATLTCQRKNCGSAGSVINGQVKYDNGGTEFGDKAVVVCNKGYRLIGNAELTCGDQGWIGRLPVCEVVKCVDPPAVSNADFRPVLESYDYGTVVTYTCADGFTLNGSRQLSCSETEQFSPSPPKCVWVDCKDPVIQNGEFVDGSRPPHGYLASVTFRCLDGYKMSGSPSLTCNISSEWSPGIPKCIKEALPTTKAPTTTTTTPGTKKPTEASPPTTKTPSTTTTTATTRGTKKPTDEDPDPDSPGGGSKGLAIGLGIIIVALVVGCIFGVICYKKKKGPHGGNTEKTAAKDGEDLALAQA